MDIKERYIAYCDLRAEVLAAEFLDSGILLDNISIRPKGTFRRTFSKDVLSAELYEQENAADTELEMEVSREGLYDMLPEGLFHQPDPEQSGFSLDLVVEGIQKTKKEEEEARRFFYAFEKEFYRSRIRIEYTERRGIDSLVGQRGDTTGGRYERDLFLRIWPELDRIDRDYRAALIQVLPRLHQIVGDVDLTAFVMQKVIGEKVTINLQSAHTEFSPLADQSVLGDSYLGFDTYATRGYYMEVPAVTIAVGPIEHHFPQEFMPGGPAYDVVHLLAKYLLSAEMDYHIEPILQEGSDELFLRTGPDEAILGFTSRI
jgi:hypothetical protein